jgi:hypothetical protein
MKSRTWNQQRWILTVDRDWAMGSKSAVFWEVLIPH